MIEVGKTYRHPRNGTEIRVLQDDAATYEMEVVAPPGLGAARAHLHQDFDQAFTLVEGSAEATVGGDRRVLVPGEEVHVPRGVTHVDVWNTGTTPATFRNRLWPSPPFLRAYAETVLNSLSDGRLDDNGELPPLQVAVIQHATGGQSYAATPPVWLQRALIPLLAAIGRRRGYAVEQLQ